MLCGCLGVKLSGSVWTGYDAKRDGNAHGNEPAKKQSHFELVQTLRAGLSCYYLARSTWKSGRYPLSEQNGMWRKAFVLPELDGGIGATCAAD